MKKNYGLILIFCGMILVMSPCLTFPAVKGPIKIGLVGPFAGPMAWLGEYSRKGVVLAIEEINASGGILGQKIELVMANDSGTPATSVASIKKLIHSEKVCAIVGPANSSCSIADGPIVHEGKVPMLTDTLSPKVTEIKSPYVMRTRPTDEYNFESVIDYFVNDRKYRKFAIAHDQTDFGMSGKDIILKHLAKYNIKPLTVEALNVEDKDFSGQLVRIKNSGAECMITNTLGMTTGLMIKQKNQLGMENVVFAGALGMENHYMPKASGAIENPKNIEGVVFSSVTTCGSAKDPVANEFCKRFKAKWDFEPSTSGAEGSNYDAIYMIKKAIEKTNSLEPIENAKAIKTLNYRGASGTYRFNEQGDSLFSSDVVTFGDKINVILLKEKKQ